MERKFKLVIESGCYFPLHFRKKFKGELIPDGWNMSVKEAASMYPSHWQEVFDEEPTLQSLTDQI